MYVLLEQYQPKEGKLEEVVSFVTEVSKEYTFGHVGVLFSNISKPANEKGYVTTYTLWKNKEAFTAFTKSAPFQTLLQSGIVEKAQALCSDIKADTLSVVETYHQEL